MASIKKQVLECLKRNRLLNIADACDIELSQRRAVDPIRSTLSRKRTLGLQTLLDLLTRDELKAACRALDLSDKGRAKSDLIERILTKSNQSSKKVDKSSNSQKATKSLREVKSKARQKSAPKNKTPMLPFHKAESVTETNSSNGTKANSTITLSQLESHLWEAANILRGSPVDRTDWKSYILPLLFFKRICDVWDEEHAEMERTYGESFADEHRFQVPEDCHWKDVREKPSNVGTTIANAMRGIETANQKHLYGVFGDAPWTNKDRLPDNLLKDLIDHFSALPLGNKVVKSDIIGDAYEYLIKKFADATNKKAGEFYTPRSVVRLMIDILDPKEGETIYDPACGTGGMLLAAVEHVRDNGGEPRTLFGKLFGQEKNLTTSSVARMNLLLHGVEDFKIHRGDTLRNPAFTDTSNSSLKTFDVVLANPPFSLEKWGREVWESDPWGRAFAGLPTDKSGDMAWVQHMVKSMVPTHGRMAVVLPQGALFRGGIEGKIRQHLLKKDLIEAVIGLAPNLFYGTGLAACILVLRNSKPVSRVEKVLIVDASTLFRKERAQNYLDPEYRRKIQDYVKAFEDVGDRARVVELSEIKDEGWTLNISRYVLPAIDKIILPLHKAISKFREDLTRHQNAEQALRIELTEGGWLS